MDIHQFGKRYQVPAILANVNWLFVMPEYPRDRKHMEPFEPPIVLAGEDTPLLRMFISRYPGISLFVPP